MRVFTVRPYDQNTVVNLQVQVFFFSVILHFENSSAHEVKVILSPNTLFAFLLL